MATHHHEPITCACGHTGFVNWKESDSPYGKSWEEYSLTGFEGEGFYVEGYAHLSDALIKLAPKCPKCGQQGHVKYA